MTTERLSGLALMNIYWEKPVNYDAVVQLFAERYPQMIICMFLSSFVKILFMKKNGIFTLRNGLLKHTDFASEWGKSCFRGLEI